MGIGRVAVVAILITLAGCPFGDDDGDPANYVAMSQIDSAYKDARCTYLARCGYFPDKATCVGAALANDYPMLFLSDQVRDSVLAGRIRYNGNKVKACFDAIAAATCDVTDESGRAYIPECQQIISGTVAGGGECLADLDCVSMSCSGNSEAPECTVGTCVGDLPPTQTPPGQMGEACSNSPIRCAQGLYCDQLSYTCQALKASGATCNDTSECAYGLGCAGLSTRTCKALPTVGQPCPDGVCRDYGNVCKSTTTGAATCQQVGLMGAQCSSYQDCSDYYPCDFNTSQCKALPAIGESCATNYRCFNSEAYCDQATTKCVATLPDGSTCTNATECTSRECTGTPDALVCGHQPSQGCP